MFRENLIQLLGTYDNVSIFIFYFNLNCNLEEF